MKTILKILVFLSFSLLNAQEHFKFYVEIPNSTIVPEVSYRKNSTVNLTFINNDLNNLFSGYTIYKFEKAFPDTGIPKLETVYYIECDNENLKNTLITNYSIYFPHAEKVPEHKLLYTPNDYMNPGDVLYHAKNLDLINVKEAWDYSKGDPDFLIGISDTRIDVNHEDLVGKVQTLYTPSAPHSHGTSSASTAAANTDNGAGIAGVGFNSSILGSDMSVYDLLQLSNNGARVVNASWYDYCNDNGIATDSYGQSMIDKIHENGTVIVAAAGNGVETGYGPGSTPCANPDKFFFPASYNHVISVSSVGSQEIGYIYPLNGEARDWRDRVEKIPGSSYYRHQANTSVDMMAPGYGNLAAVPDIGDGVTYFRFGGTSSAAPHLAGGVSLILTANACLNTNEVESLLKLTSVRLDSISTNVPYIGKIGAGRMDIGKATKAAWQMNPANGGEVLLKNRSFNRWHFELLNSPEYIRLKNEEFIKDSDIVFRAKKAIIFHENTLLEPGPGKSHYLYVENTDTCFNFNKSYNPSSGKKENKNLIEQNNTLKLYPNPSKDYINIQTDEDIQRVEVFDTSGRLMKTGYTKKISVQDLPIGNYLIKIYSGRKNVESIKFTRN